MAADARKPGLYWIRPLGLDEWEVAEWEVFSAVRRGWWKCLGDADRYDDSEFSEIDERTIERPQPPTGQYATGGVVSTDTVASRYAGQPVVLSAGDDNNLAARLEEIKRLARNDRERNRAMVCPNCGASGGETPICTVCGTTKIAPAGAQ